jgi:hypothetical protein
MVIQVRFSVRTCCCWCMVRTSLSKADLAGPPGDVHIKYSEEPKSSQTIPNEISLNRFCQSFALILGQLATSISSPEKADAGSSTLSFTGTATIALNLLATFRRLL